MHLQDIDQALRGTGLICFGGFEPTLADGIGGHCLLLLGNAGPAMWHAYRTRHPDGKLPLDAWTRGVVDPVASGLNATALYPFEGPPFLPFQQWALRCGTLFASPLGINIHAVHGLWHAYRAALVFSVPVKGLPPVDDSTPCDTCVDRPCLSACPAGAFDGLRYDVPACLAHLEKAEGADCRETGCLARHACPVGRSYVYEPDQAAFHMAAFRRLATD